MEQSSNVPSWFLLSLWHSPTIGLSSRYVSTHHPTNIAVQLSELYTRILLPGFQCFFCYWPMPSRILLSRFINHCHSCTLSRWILLSTWILFTYILSPWTISN